MMMSACVKWAKEHVDEFNVLLTRQLSSLDSTSQIYKDCVDRAKAHATMLEEVGLDFKDLVGVVTEAGAVPNQPEGLGIAVA